MFLKSKQRIFYYTICLALILNIALGVIKVDSTTESQTIVLFDESHAQFFNHTFYSKALLDLEEKGMKIVINNETINETTLDGVDVVIITNPGERFEIEENVILTKYLQNGNSMLLLANPLNEENSSLNGAGYYLNEILDEAQSDLESFTKFWTYDNDIGDFRRSDVVCNDFSYVGDINYLILNINTSSHEVLSLNENVSSIVTYSCSISNPSENVIPGSPEAYAKTVYNNIHTPYASDLSILASATPTDSDIRVLLGGSSIMFSDLNDTHLESSWYESENNSILWKNMIDWLAKISEIEPTPSFSMETVLLFLISTIIIAFFLLIGGMIFFTIGSAKKHDITKAKGILEPEPKTKKVEPSEKTKIETIPEDKTSKVTKRDKRLRQIKKDTRKRRKK